MINSKWNKGLILVCIVLLLITTVFPCSSRDIDSELNVISKQTKTTYDLLIIAPEEFIPSLRSLVDHKNLFGVKTVIIDVDEIYEEFTGRDQAEQVKYFIKHVVEEWNVQYVLLVGGRKGQSRVEEWWIPVRYCHIEFLPPDGRFENRFISDLYFADIYTKNGNFSSWDTDNDSIFSEWPQNASAEDIIDLAPDVAVGRLPCRNVYEVKTTVQKIIDYEQEKCDDSWFKNIVVISFKTDRVMPGWNGENIQRLGLTYMQDFNQIKLWASNGTLRSSRDVIKAFNQGCGFIWFFGGANPKLWGVYLSNESILWRFIFRNSEIPLLVNNKKLPICLDGSGCHNCQFNVSIGNTLDFRPFHGKNWVSTITAECMGERLLTHSYGGCIAVIGPTAMGHDSIGIVSRRGGCDWLEIHFLEDYNIKKINVLGDVWRNSLCQYVQNFTIDWTDTTSKDDSIIVKAAETWSLFGDPSLQIGGYPERYNDLK